MCGYLRYYYPYEFITAALNIFGGKLDKTSEIIKYAKKINITISPPKWGVSKNTYFFDKERKAIAKGLSSVKYIGDDLAEKLFELSKYKYKNFTDLLIAMNENKCDVRINSKQLDILIKLDFFSEFGNQRELLEIVDIFSNFFNNGEAKQIRRSQIECSIIGDTLKGIIEKYAVGVKKNGEIAKSYTLLDVYSILIESEMEILSLKLPDVGDIIKVKNFYEYTGYFGYVSGKDEDRRKLFILDIKPVKRRSDGKQFGYNIITKSIGSGKESMFTVMNRTYNNQPFNVKDVIYCNSYTRDGKYFTLTEYKILEVNQTA